MPLSLVEEEVERLVANGFVGRLQEPQGFSLLKAPTDFRQGGTELSAQRNSAMDCTPPRDQ